MPTNRYNRNYDEFRCFHIRDFRPGDAIMVAGRKRGIVVEVNYVAKEVSYKDMSGEVSWANLDDFIFLDYPTPGWLDTGE